MLLAQNVAGRATGAIELAESRVGGDLELTKGAGVTLGTTTFSGNIQLSRIDGAVVLTADLVRGDVEITGNLGGVTLTGNHINGNLQCSGNDPAPTGENNTVRGDQEGQCRGL